MKVRKDSIFLAWADLNDWFVIIKWEERTIWKNGDDEEIGVGWNFFLDAS